MSDSTSAATKKICCRCFQPSTANCALCKAVWYCGKACQKKDWELGHKIKCKEIRAAAAAKAAGSDGASTTSSSSVDGAPNPSSSPPLDAEAASYSTAELSLPAKWLYPSKKIGELMNTQATFPPKPVGLLNPKKANSCFYNVVLQTLIYTKPFVNLLDSLNHTPTDCKLSSTDKFCVICAITAHRKLVLKHSRDSIGQVDPNSKEPMVLPLENGDPKPILPVSLLRNLDKLSSDYQLGQQEDSHDTMKNFLHLFDDSWQRNYGAYANSTPGQRFSQRTLETTPISQLFGGYLLSELKCASCGKFTSPFEFYLDLSLELIEHTDDLSEMLESFSKPEKLDANNLYKCSLCFKPTRARKQITIYQQSNILMIQLKRFRMGMFGKVNKYIKFPVELSLRKYMSGCKLAADDEMRKADLSLQSELSTVYKLYSIIVHLDLLNVSSFGHYVCYIRDPNYSGSSASGEAQQGDWLKFDDDTITRVTQAEVLKQKAYILFYQRTTPFISSDKVAAEEPLAAASSPSPSATANGTSASSPPPVASSTDASSSTAATSSSSSDALPSSDPVLSSSPSSGSGSSATAPASEDPVQCIGGCGFWGKPSTGNMCSQCFRKDQEEKGLIPKQAPKPKPSEDDADEQPMDPQMRMVMNARVLEQVQNSPALQERYRTQLAFRAQIDHIRMQMMMDTRAFTAANRPGAGAADADADEGGFMSSNSPFAQQLRQQMAQQQQLQAMQKAQDEASRAAQLPPNPLEAAAGKPTATKGKKGASGANGDKPSEPVNHAGAKIGRNDTCPCGSGRKFKVCHMNQK